MSGVEERSNSGVKMVKLGELMLSRGGSINPANFPDETFELYSIPAHDLGGPEILFGAEIGSSKQCVCPGDVLVSKIIPHIRRARVVEERTGKRQIASGEWIVFRGGQFDPDYLRHFLLSDGFHRQFMNTIAGVGGSLVRARPEYVKRILLPLPSRDEQRRIAEILDRADEIRAKRRQQLAHLDTLTQSIFHDMFGRVKTTSLACLGDLAQVSSGITKGRRTSDVTREVPYLAVANVQAGYLNLNAVKVIKATEAEIERYRLQKGDLLMTEGGDPDKLGRGTVWQGEIRECIHQNHIFRVRLSESSPILVDYLSSFLGSLEARSYFLRSAKQTTGIASINMTQLRSLPIPLPPLNEQRIYVERIHAVEASRVKIERALAADEELFTSLRSRAFRGEL